MVRLVLPLWFCRDCGCPVPAGQGPAGLFAFYDAAGVPVVVCGGCVPARVLGSGRVVAFTSRTVVPGVEVLPVREAIGLLVSLGARPAPVSGRRGVPARRVRPVAASCAVGVAS